MFDIVPTCIKIGSGLGLLGTVSVPQYFAKDTSIVLTLFSIISALYEITFFYSISTGSIHLWLGPTPSDEEEQFLSENKIRDNKVCQYGIVVGFVPFCVVMWYQLNTMTNWLTVDLNDSPDHYAEAIIKMQYSWINYRHATATKWHITNASFFKKKNIWVNQTLASRPILYISYYLSHKTIMTKVGAIFKSP